MSGRHRNRQDPPVDPPDAEFIPVFDVIYQDRSVIREKVGVFIDRVIRCPDRKYVPLLVDAVFLHLAAFPRLIAHRDLRQYAVVRCAECDHASEFQPRQRHDTAIFIVKTGPAVVTAL